MGKNEKLKPKRKLTKREWKYFEAMKLATWNKLAEEMR